MVTLSALFSIPLMFLNSDDPRFRYSVHGDAEVVNKIWEYEAFCSATVNQCTGFGMEGSGVEFDKSMYEFLVWNEYGLRE